MSTLCRSHTKYIIILTSESKKASYDPKNHHFGINNKVRCTAGFEPAFFRSKVEIVIMTETGGTGSFGLHTQYAITTVA